MGKCNFDRRRFERRFGHGLGGLIFLVVGAVAASAQCSDSVVDIRGSGTNARFTVEIADDAQEQSRGLMFREELPRSSGMLFVYPNPRRAVFWMRNTLIPLDMIFAGPDGRVKAVHSNAIPLDETPIDGGQGVLAVLEINGGMATLLGIKEGDEIRHPAFSSADAAWPCE